MMVGYALDHAGDCYRMYNPITKGIHQSRDIKWLNRMYFKSVRFHNTEDLITIEDRKRRLPDETIIDVNEPNVQRSGDEFDNNNNPNKRYLECPGSVKVQHLKKFITMKYELSDDFLVSKN